MFILNFVCFFWEIALYVRCVSEMHLQRQLSLVILAVEESYVIVIISTAKVWRCDLNAFFILIDPIAYMQFIINIQKMLNN